MKATDTLMAEHRVIERVLIPLESAAEQLAGGKPIPAEFFLKAADFIKTFADDCHHGKEEGILFVEMVAAGMPKDAGPIGVMLAEHEQGRQFTRAMKTAAERWQAGDQGASAQIVENARGYVALLRQHIQKEDRILFPMADKAIPVARHDQLNAAFDRAEVEETGAGVHEKYLRVAEELERAVKG